MQDGSDEVEKLWREESRKRSRMQCLVVSIVYFVGGVRPGKHAAVLIEVPTELDGFSFSAAEGQDAEHNDKN